MKFILSNEKIGQVIQKTLRYCLFRPIRPQYKYDHITIKINRITFIQGRCVGECIPLNAQEYPPKPDVSWLTLPVWKSCCDMEAVLPCFKGLSTDIVSTPVNCKLGQLEVHANPPDWDDYSNPSPPPPPPPGPSTGEGEGEGDGATITGHWDTRLNSFQKLVMVKAFREEKVSHQFSSTNPNLNYFFTQFSDFLFISLAFSFCFPLHRLCLL